MLGFSLAKTTQKVKRSKQSNKYLGRERQSFDSKQRVKVARSQADMQNSPTINSLRQNNDYLGVGHSTSANLLHFKEILVFQKASTKKHLNTKSIRIVTFCKTCKTDSSLSTNTSNSIKNLHATSTQFK